MATWLVVVFVVTAGIIASQLGKIVDHLAAIRRILGAMHDRSVDRDMGL